MTRHRAHLFGKPIAPWRPTRSLAEQDAVDAGEASRAPSGFAYHGVGLTIVEDDGDVPFTPDQERWAEALAVLKRFGERTEDHIAERMRLLADDPAGRARWRQILDRVKQVREAGERRLD